MWQEVLTQVSFGAGGEWIGIRHSSIRDLIKDWELDRPNEVFKRVRIIEEEHRRPHNDKLRKEMDRHKAEAARNRAKQGRRR